MAVTVTLALVTIGGAFHLFLEQSLRASLNTGLEGVASTAAESVHRFVSSSLRDARAVATSLPTQVIVSRDEAAAEAHLARMCEIFPQFDNGLFILDAQGEFLADFPRHDAMRGVSFAFRDYYQRTIQTRQGVVGRPYESERSNEPVCTFTAPLFDAQGNLLGLVGCSVKLLGDEALSVLHGQTIGETGYIYLIDQTRLMIMHPSNERILKRNSPPGANLMFDQALKGFEGVGDTVNSRGVPMVAAFKRVPETDWILVAQQPRQEALAPLRNMRVRLAGGYWWGPC
ncbi:MAG: cache domain-containing protein [Pseudomonadota bacterium]